MDHGLDDQGPMGVAVDRRTLDALFSQTYEELRRLASSIRRADALATINPTALVNEAWIKLAHSAPAVLCSRLHFKRVAARAMRQVLVEAARRRAADKRGGGVALVTYDDQPDGSDATAADVVALDAALDELGKLNPRQAAIVESRFFGGLELTEAAALLRVSEATVTRDWRMARAWLAKALREGR